MIIMRWLIRLAFPALGLLLILIFFGINDPETVASLSNPQTPESSKEIPAFEGLVPSPVPDNGPTIIFKWQDSTGGWHYADSPPQRGSWNALAIEPSSRSAVSQPPSTDWRAPYHAPFALTPSKTKNDS